MIKHQTPLFNPRCENSSDHESCKRNAMPGHIYCTPCRVANGGYERYNPPAFNLVSTRRV